MHWSAPEYSYHNKDVAWYAAVFGIAVGLVLLALWQRNFLFVVFIIVAAITLMAWGRRQPAIIEFELSNAGLRIGGEQFAKESFNGFYLKNFGKDWSRLYLKKSGKLSNYLVLLLPKNIFDMVRNSCLNHWAEIERQESLVDTLADFFGF